LSRKSEEDGLPARYQAKRLDKGGLLSHHHTRRLDSLIAIASEMGRVYRSTINGMISTSDGARLIYQLKEIRAAREAVNAEAALAIANVPPPPPAKIDVSIITVPAGHFISPEQSQQIANGEFLKQVEHTSIPLSDYARNAAAPAEADRELNAAIDAAVVFVKPGEPARYEEPHGIIPQSPEEAQLLSELEGLPYEAWLQRAGIANVDQS
jgi:hypothetical protein